MPKLSSLGIGREPGFDAMQKDMRMYALARAIVLDDGARKAFKAAGAPDWLVKMTINAYKSRSGWRMHLLWRFALRRYRVEEVIAPNPHDPFWEGHFFYVRQKLAWVVECSTFGLALREGPTAADLRPVDHLSAILSAGLEFLVKEP